MIALYLLIGYFVASAYDKKFNPNKGKRPTAGVMLGHALGIILVACIWPIALIPLLTKKR